MAASFLLSECLEKIFSNLLDIKPIPGICTSTKDLHSCTLVSRHWCRISTPILYSYPFHHFRCSGDFEIYPYYFRLIRTLLSCIPKSEIEQIKSSNSSNIQRLLSNLSLSNQKQKSSPSTFNYITFIRGLIFDNKLINSNELFYHKDIWLFPYISINNNITKDQFSKISIPIINHLISFMCKYCNDLTTLQLLDNLQSYEFCNNVIKLLTLKDCNENTKLNNLKEIFLINVEVTKIVDKKSSSHYLTLLNSVCNLNLLYNEIINSIEEASLLSQFISLQKNLRHLILSESKLNAFYGYNNIGYNNYNIVFNSLPKLSENLQILEFKYLSFNNINEDALNSLCLLKNIKELKFCNCKGINNNLNPWAKNLSKLEVFEFVGMYISIMSEEFIIEIIRSSSNTLTKLVLNCNIELIRIFKQIPLYSHSLIYLELPCILPIELISIFKSCTQLVHLSITLSGDNLWEGDFRNLGKFIPKTLQKIQCKGINNLVFISNELKCFFEECVNNDSKLKYLEIIGECNIDKEYYDIANEFGVELRVLRSC
ncbi:hypothetical protein C1645_874970 [Glomus cerebriforme]|uniref:Uncharacterized protein n=1 Tax=Glomus cerebriforme TaxID=658196 RepID=A0A397TB07_9GLOM|nr:hypothetical protein C1645_874970 [Glomus cerebriforme]